MQVVNWHKPGRAAMIHEDLEPCVGTEDHSVLLTLQRPGDWRFLSIIFSPAEAENIGGLLVKYAKR